MRHSISVLPLVLVLMLGCVVVFAAESATSSGSSASVAGTKTVLGEMKPVGRGTIQTWAELDATGKPASIGVTFTEGMLEGLPDTLPGTEYALSLPPQATGVPFTHFVLNWNPKGHIPAGIYDVPHFDFHFYIISPEARAQMTATGDDLARVLKAPAAECLPPGYITAEGAYEPHMGNHYVDSASPEFRGKPFTITFVYGAYDGKVAFLEPMITRAFLETKPDFSQPIKLPARYPVSGYYPTRYALTYDAANKQYRLALQGLTLRQTTPEAR